MNRMCTRVIEIFIEKFKKYQQTNDHLNYV